ncbi:MAG TPA: NAD(P)/FAD-dependent oxidoreductase, partial [Candidatus Elarobacter sp.]|nr:NAD(P)/FAD-dependent oxidoreductase [Candidatus Elarobacter sp.]
MLDAEIVIVGAGFSGLGMAIQLKQHGNESFVVLEQAAEVGGTWRDNAYPGCACDIPSMLYSFSFERGSGWTRTYPRQPELLEYLKTVAEKRGLLSHIRFNARLDEARFDEETSTWRVRIADGAMLTCRFLISAMGPLSKPKFPDVPGIDRFAGESFHSARWRHHVDLRGKNVVVIGTGASAIQFVPQIAPQAGKLTILQRTPPWIIPRGDAEVGPLRRALRRWAPGYAWLVRKLVYWSQEVRAIGFVVNPKLLEAREKLIRRYIERSVTDPDLRRKVTPEYRAGCKRILISDDYYPAIQRENVELVTTPLAEIREHSVVDANGREYPADVVIYGTGFKATEGIVPARVYGRGGAELSEKWRDGMSAYLGTTVAGYPNLFFLIGPNTGLGHNSMIFMMEAQYRYILSALDEVKRRGATSVEVKPEVQAHFNERLQAKMKGTVWATGCSSWYQDANGKNVSLWPGFTFAYRRLTAR